MKRTLLALTFIAAQQTFAQDITSNLEAYFSFNDGTANVTAGQVTQGGSVFGAFSDNDRFGNSNKAMFFDGIDDYINFGDLTNYRFGSNSFTVALWINADMGQVNQGIPIGKRGFTGGDKAYMFGWDSNGPGTTTGELMLYYRDDNGAVGYSNWQTQIISGNTWMHIAMVFDRSAQMLHLYVDGVLESSRDISGLGTFDATGTSAGELMAGRSSNGGQYFSGLVDDIYVFRRALTGNDISALFNAPDPTLDVKENALVTLKAFPNPAHNLLTISGSENATAVLTSANGLVVETIELNGETTIDVSSYAPGVYFIRTQDGQTVKFIKE
ncbi:MAG: T9SS type A sorting domain-containing protein [Bacteroidetes bacterium]|nr:MAG: T9SS type A sorting domain-containing protein [Bacteroidota bacterium]